MNKQITLPRKVFFSGKKKISIFEAGGKIIAETLTISPPGVPIVLMGEKLTPSHIKQIMNLPEGLSINGYFNPKDVKVSVLRERVNSNLKLKKSDNLIIKKYDGVFFAYNSLLGFPSILDKKTVEIISDFKAYKRIVESKFNGHNGYNELIEDLMDRYYLVSGDEREILKRRSKKYLHECLDGKGIDSLYLVLTDLCNFRCPYCLPRVANEGNLKKELLTEKDAFKVVDEYISFIRKRGLKEGKISFRGGEPLLNFALLGEIVHYTEKIKDLRFKYTIITNASLIDTEIAQFLAKHKIKVTVSIDGQEMVHNKTRKLGSKGSFGAVKKGIQELTKAEANFHSVYTTLTDYNFRDLSPNLTGFLKQNQIKSWVIEPDLTNEISFSTEEIVKKILSIKKYAKRFGIEVSGYWEYPYKRMFSSILYDQKFGFCKTACGELISLKPNGEFTTCNYMPITLDDVSSFSEVKNSKAFNNMVKERCFTRLDNCRGCDIEGHCRGGCTITYFEARKKGKKHLLENRCRLYRKFTEELIREKIRDIS